MIAEERQKAEVRQGGRVLTELELAELLPNLGDLTERRLWEVGDLNALKTLGLGPWKGIPKTAK